MEPLDYNLLFRWFEGLSMDDAVGGSGRNPSMDFRGDERKNSTRASTTDPDAGLCKKGKGAAAKL